MPFTKITSAGAGTMGSQVAWQMAFHGKHVTVYDAIPAGLEKGKAFHQQYAELFTTRRGATRQEIDDTFARLTYTTDLSTAVSDGAQKSARYLDEQFIQRGHIGVTSGRGFYRYPDPAYAQPGFIS